MPPNHTLPFTIQVVHSQLISKGLRDDIISLCNRAYEENLQTLYETFADPTHVLGYCDGVLVSHAMWVTRYLQPGNSPPLRTAYVELVATDPGYRQRGFAAAILKRLVAEIQDFELAALSPFSVEYYGRLGWEAWRGPLFIRADGKILATPADEQVMIYRLPKTATLDLNAPLTADWRAGELW